MKKILLDEVKLRNMMCKWSSKKMAKKKGTIPVEMATPVEQFK